MLLEQGYRKNRATFHAVPPAPRPPTPSPPAPAGAHPRGRAAPPPQRAPVTAPTRIVWERQDQIIPVECGTLYHQAIPGAELVVIEQCGHAPYLEKPDEFVRIAMDFLP